MQVAVNELSIAGTQAEIHGDAGICRSVSECLEDGGCQVGTILVRRILFLARIDTGREQNGTVWLLLES